MGTLNGIIGGPMSGNPYNSWLADHSRRIPYVGLNLDVIEPPVITYDENMNRVTITADDEYDIYYTITTNDYPPVDLSNYNIYQRNSNIKTYSGPFVVSSPYYSAGTGSYKFTISAVAVRRNVLEKQSVVSCEHFEGVIETNS